MCLCSRVSEMTELSDASVLEKMESLKVEIEAIVTETNGLILERDNRLQDLRNTENAFADVSRLAFILMQQLCNEFGK